MYRRTNYLRKMTRDHGSPAPKGLNNTAEGRGAHPGKTQSANTSTLKGLHKLLCNPFRVEIRRFVCSPGCAPRPWAAMFHPFRVKKWLLVLLFALGFPIAALFFAVLLEFDLALDLVAVELAAEVDGKFVAVTFKGDREGHLAVLDLAVLDLDLAHRADYLAGPLVTFLLELGR